MQIQWRVGVFAALAMSAVAVAGSTADADFKHLADEAVEHYLAAQPESATTLGDHRFDDRLADYSDAARERNLAQIKPELDALGRLDAGALTGANRVDARILAVQLQLWQFQLSEERPQEWDPLSYNASLGDAIYALTARDFAPPQQRLRSVARRLAAIPRVVAQIKANLRHPPRIHTETAIRQTAGTIALIQNGLDGLLAEAPALKPEVASAQASAIRALTDYQHWLQDDVLPRATGDFRLGPERFRRKLRLTLDSDLSPEEILTRAEQELAKATAQLYTTARPLFQRYFPEDGRLDDRPHVIRAVFEHLARQHVDDATVVARAKQITDEATAFVRAQGLITLPTAPLRVIELPEFQRGVAIAYCDAPGALEPQGRTFFKVSPTPSDWTAARKESFFREYNDYMLRDLTVHEAMPGHYVQLAHANLFRAPTLVRAVWSSGSFVEGWAVYAESVMTAAGYGGPEVRMQQLKMRVRAIINAILDQKIHMQGMTEEEALALMMNQGFQEEGEAVGKWRRACQSSTQLSTYFVGTIEHDAMRAAAEQKWGAGFDLKKYHDAVLSFGSPPVKYVRQELGL